MVECSIMVQWVVRSIPHGGPIEQLLVPANALDLSLLCNKDCGMCYPVWDGAFKRSLAANRKE